MAVVNISYVTLGPVHNVTLLKNEIDSRYKCPQLLIEFRGKTKMIKTVFTNIEKVAKSILVDPHILLKYIALECGSNVNEAEYYISGKHDCEELSNIFQKFMMEYILCYKCGLPELVHSIKSKLVCYKCMACGDKRQLVLKNEKFEKYALKVLQDKIKKPEQPSIDQEYEDLKSQFDLL